MFFELHDEHTIGYKELTDADLGRSETSNQTHIGLFDDILTFLPNDIRILDAMFIYNDKAEILPLSFTRIKNPNGTYRSPRIRAGRRKEKSVYSFIRHIVKTTEPKGIWYLVWFGLKSKQPAFWLFEKGSTAYRKLCDLGVDFYPEVRSRIDFTHPAFKLLIDYLEYIVNYSGIDFAEDLELNVQTGRPVRRRVRKYDIKKAYERALRIGREGEILADLYLQDQLSRGLILDYCWVNSDKESGSPYDFCVDTLDGKEVFLEVKTTDYRFEQKMIFSDREIAFASEQGENYCVFRVYCDEYGDRCFRICYDVEALFIQIDEKTGEYVIDMSELADVQNIKIAISPCHSSFVCSEPVFLTR